jgi:hypothetical protein
LLLNYWERSITSTRAGVNTTVYTCFNLRNASHSSHGHRDCKHLPVTVCGMRSLAISKHAGFNRLRVAAQVNTPRPCSTSLLDAAYFLFTIHRLIYVSNFSSFVRVCCCARVPSTTQQHSAMTRSQHTEFRRQQCRRHAQPSRINTSPGANPPVFVSPELASSVPDGDSTKREPPPPGPSGGESIVMILKRAFRTVERQISNLQLAIAELAVLAFLSGVGTVIDQEQVRLPCSPLSITAAVCDSAVTPTGIHKLRCPD